MDRTIAVVIPVYNAGCHLRKCIDSVINQTLKDFCLVLVDDGSTDGSGQICDAYSVKDSRIKVIHQQNKGSVLARTTGVLSEYAQDSKYIFLADADDTLMPDALRLLYEEAEKNHLDCVCASTQKMWKGVKFHSKYQAPCFDNPKMYTQEDIINELYISCFGISNYPVTLYAKLYSTELLTKVISNPPIVKFMGEDLSVTLRLLTETQSLSIIPNVIYNYRIGGNTSKYMPYMFDDFLSLYRFKTEMRKKFPIPQDAEYYMSVELLNVLLTWFEMFKQQGKHTENDLIAEIKRVSVLPEVLDCLKVLRDRKKTHLISAQLEKGEYEKISELVIKKIKKDTPKRILKQLLYSL